MILKGKYILKYSIDNIEKDDLVVDVKLMMVEGQLKPRQNIYEGICHVDGVLYNKVDLSTCINAKFAAENIGLILKEELIIKTKTEKKKIKILKETLK